MLRWEINFVEFIYKGAKIVKIQLKKAPKHKKIQKIK